MSGGSIGSILGGILGFALAPFTGGYSLLVTTGLMAAGRLVGGLLDPPPAQQITGPRLTDLGQQTATYGAFIPRVYGKIAVMGNVFWIENNKLKEVATTQSQGGKGGPPEVNTTTYKYYGTFAVGLCEGLDPALYGTGAELVLSKLWIGEKLFYNRYSTDSETVLTSIDRETKFKFYSGTETQLPEPRMEADLGVANTPAYRGLAYLVIYDMDVEAYGNTIAGVQIKAELITNASFVWTSASYSALALGPQSTLEIKSAASGNYVYVVTRSQSKIWVIDATTPGSLVNVNQITVTSGSSDIFYDSGFLYITSIVTGKVQKYSLSSPTSPAFISELTITGCRIARVYNGYLYVGNDTLNRVEIYSSTTLSSITNFSVPDNPLSIVVDNTYVYVACNIGTGTTLQIWDISNITAPFLVGSTSFQTGCNDLVINGNYLYTSADARGIIVVDISNKTSPAVVANLVDGTAATSHYGAIILENLFFCVRKDGILNKYDITVPASPTLSATYTVGVTSSQSLIRNGDYFYVSSGGIPGNSQLITPFLFKKVLNETLFLLKDIVNAESLHSNLLDSSDLDVSLLTQTVRGYRISSVGSIRGGVEPLQAAWPFDVVQDGYKIKYVPRGGANVATITYDKLDARGDNASPGIQISNSREMESQLPAKVSIKYMDINRSYNTGEQYYERINTDAVNHSDLEMPIVFNAQEAAGKAQTLVYLYWLERYDISFKLPPEYLQLQPSDVITLTTPDASYNLRLKQINYTQDGRLECQAKYNNAAIYSPSALGEEGLPPDDTLSPPGTTTYELLDIPCLQDIYNVSGFPVAMTGAKKGWPGGVLARSDDGGASYVTVGAVPSPGTVMGLATNTIGSHNGLLLDKASVLNVTLTKGSLSSVSELQMFNGANHFAYGIDGRWEIIAAQNCVLQGDGSYKLSDLMRGRFGTEIYTGTHAVNDNVIYLASAAMLFQTLNSSAIGLTRHYKGVNFQSTLDTATARTFIYNGVNLECLSPVYLNGNRHPTTNDWTLTWIRRGRINNEWKDLIDVPVGETSESYDLEVYSSNAYTTLKRTFTALSSATATYTSAQQVTDFGSNQATLFVKIYQNSATVGRGYPLTTSITR